MESIYLYFNELTKIPILSKFITILSKFITILSKFITILSKFISILITKYEIPYLKRITTLTFLILIITLLSPLLSSPPFHLYHF